MRLCSATFLLLSLCPAAETKPAQPSKFIEAVGRRAALLGREDGTFEAWLFPIKAVRDFRLSVYLDGALDPTPLADIAEQVIVSPGASTIVFSHAAFTIRETWVASIEEPLAAVLLDIDTSRPLKLRASFIPEMKPMWPASFGGQSSDFDETEKMFVLGEGLRRFRVAIASPAFSRSSEQIGHQLPDRTVLLEMDIPLETARKGPIPIVIAASREMAREWTPKAATLLKLANDYYDRFASRTTTVSTGLAALDRAYDHARFALEKGWACNDKVGCGLIAGWGPSGASERPGFGWYFGGDAFMNSWAILDYGDFDRVRALLAFLRDKQRADGKLPHEWTQSAALLDWSQYPYGYYHADTTPLYLFSLWRYVRRSGDGAFLDESWPSVERAWSACLSYLDEDGLLSNAKGGAGAVETGALSGKVAKDIYLQGVWLAALDAVEQMSRLRNNAPLTADAHSRLEKARLSLATWFDPTKGHFAFAQLKDGSNYPALSGWQAFAIAYGGLSDAIARPAARSLNRATLATDWGVRLFATDSPFYDALSYNDGSVWPFVTGFAIQAQFRRGWPEAGRQLLEGLARIDSLMGLGFQPEYLSGDRFQALPRTVPHQLFSASPIIEGTISGLLGLDGDALNQTLDLRPPSRDFEFRNYRVGASTIDGRRSGADIHITVRGPQLRIRLHCPSALRELPPAADARTSCPLPSAPVFDFAAYPLEPGDRSRQPRLLDAEPSPNGTLVHFDLPPGLDNPVLKLRGVTVPLSGQSSSILVKP